MASLQVSPNTFLGVCVANLIALAGDVSSAFSFKGYWHLANLFGSFVSTQQTCVINVFDHARFSFRLSDPYWSRLLSSHYVYEPEVEFVIRKFGSRNFAFLDCGANFGYWSIFCTSGAVACSRAIAIEASPATFQFLEKNRQLNGGRFVSLQKAIYSEVGKSVVISQSGTNHAGASIANGSNFVGSVETITLDAVADEYLNPTDPVIVKLDVEGAEIDALKGASKLLALGTLIIYEDHGMDASSAVTKFVLEDLGLNVYFLDHNRELRRVFSAEDASALKVNRKKGYNFLAAARDSPFANTSELAL